MSPSVLVRWSRNCGSRSIKMSRHIATRLPEHSLIWVGCLVRIPKLRVVESWLMHRFRDRVVDIRFTSRLPLFCAAVDWFATSMRQNIDWLMCMVNLRKTLWQVGFWQTLQSVLNTGFRLVLWARSTRAYKSTLIEWVLDVDTPIDSFLFCLI